MSTMTFGQDKRALAPAGRLSRLQPLLIVAAALGLMLVAACSGDETTQSSLPGDGQRVTAPDVIVLPPTPTPTPTPTFIPLGLPLPTATATPRPVSTPVPDPPAATPLPDIGSDLPTPRMHSQSLLLDDGRVLFSGGFLIEFADDGQISDLRPHPFLEIYDPESESWSLVQPIDWNPIEVHATLLANGNVLILALEQPEDEYNSLWPYSSLADDNRPLPLYTVFLLDVGAATMSEISSTTIPRVGPSLVPLDGGRVFVGGGISLEIDEDSYSLPIVREAEIYDPARNVWSMAAPLAGDAVDMIIEPTFQWFGRVGARVGHVLTGEDEENDSLGVLMFYDPAANAWETTDTFELDSYDSPWRAMGSATGELYLFFGNRIEIYDPSSGEWTYTYGPCGVPPGASVSELDDGRLLIAGGVGGEIEGWGPTASLINYVVDYFCLFSTDTPRITTEIYDPSTALWAAGPDMDEPRSCHTATVLPGGVLLNSGALVWTEDEVVVSFTNSMEVVPAATLQAVDTVTPLTDVLVSFTSGWETCIAQVDLARQDFIPNGVALAPDALEELLASAEQAMETLDSYAMVDASLRVNRLSPYQDSKFRRPYCNYTETQYDKSGKSRGMWTFFDERRISDQRSSIRVGATNYSKELDQDEWTVEYDRITDREEGREFYWLGEEFQSYLIDPLLGIGETLDGVDVHVVRAELAYDGEATGDTITFWIGVEDNLLRRMFYMWSASPHDDGSVDTEYTLIEFRYFNMDFDILPPLTPEEAAHPRAFGWSRCENASWLSFVPRTSDDATAVTESPASIVMRASQAMDALTSYATVDARYGFGSWSQSCDLYLDQHMGEGLSTSRKVVFYDGELGSDESRIVIGEDEYNRDSEDGAWTLQAYDGSMPISWQHAEFLNLALSDQVINLRVVDIELVDGVASYRISGELVRAGDDDDTSEDTSTFGTGSEDSLSLWIGVDDYLLRSAVTRRSRDGSSSFNGRDHHLVEFHSFNGDFDIQAPEIEE